MNYESRYFTHYSVGRPEEGCSFHVAGYEHPLSVTVSVWARGLSVGLPSLSPEEARELAERLGAAADAAEHIPNVLVR